MPKEYEAIRDSLRRRGKSMKEAKRIAAMTYNKRHPGHANPWAHEKPKKDKHGFY